MKKYRYRKNPSTDNLYRIQKYIEYYHEEMNYWQTQYQVYGKEFAKDAVKGLNEGKYIIP